MSGDLDLGPILERNHQAEEAAAHPFGGLLDAWVRSARDVPVLATEVERLRLEVHWLECPLPPDAGCGPCLGRVLWRRRAPELRWTEGKPRVHR